ncbi:MAG: DNA-3-methyladenine glycosylase [Thermotaleaceae bacterium]
MKYFQYGQKEIEYLKKKDKKLSAAIERIGLIEREITPDPFEALVSSIVSQQISKKAAQTVWNRFCELIDGVTAENILKVSEERIQKCGMSMRKVGYIRRIAEAAATGEIDFHHLYLLSDQEIIKKLSALHGVGVWTVEMLLIFSLNRLDIVSYKDLAICRGMMNLYGLKTLSKEQFEKYKKRYSPYGSVASLYLWELSAE